MLFPQKQEIRRIQISHSQQLLLLSQPELQPHPLFENKPLPLPKQENNRIIQIQLQLFPKPLMPLQQLLEHPQLVAVKSLILSASRFYYGLSYVYRHVNVSTYLKKKLDIFGGSPKYNTWEKDLN